MSRKSNLYENNAFRIWNLVLAVTIVAIGISSAIYLFKLDTHTLYFYGDATAHSHWARTFFDSQKPGFFEHLGTVWLPLPHLILSPFTLIDPLFRSGFVGLVVSLPLHAVTSVLISKMIQRQTGNIYASLVGSAVYAFNPNFLYLSTTPLTEAPFMFFFVMSANYFQKSLVNSRLFNLYRNGPTSGLSILSMASAPARNLDLIICAGFISLATLCRYEAWILPIFVLVILTVYKIRVHNKNSDKKRTSFILPLSSFAVISFSGIIFWLLWNWYSFGDALEFANNPIYSAAGQALLGGNRAFLYLQPMNVFKVYGTALLYVIGPAVVVTAVLGFFCSTIFNKDVNNCKKALLYIFLIIPSILTIISMTIGVGEMNLTRWFNSRFIILIAPLIALLSGVFIDYVLKKLKGLKSGLKRAIILSIIVVLFFYPIFSPLLIVVAFDDAMSQYYYGPRIAQFEVGRILRSSYHGDGQILLIAQQQSDIAIESGLSLKTFHVLRDTDLNSTEFKSPWIFNDYLVLSREPQAENHKATNYWNKNQETLSQYYSKIYENNYYMVFSKNNGDNRNCFQFDSVELTIFISCKNSDLTEVYNYLNNLSFSPKENYMQREKANVDADGKKSPNTWVINANLEINKGSTFYINSSDTSWLKMNSANGEFHFLKSHGNLIIDSVKITGWDVAKNDYPSMDANGTEPKSYVLISGDAGTTEITNSEIAYLGYDNVDGNGLSSYSGITLKNNRIHDLYYGLKSSHNQGPSNDIIENNEFYHNQKYGMYMEGYNMSIKYNDIYGNGEHGIICSSSCYNSVIDSNRIYGNSGEGIMLYDNASGSVIRDNNVSSNRDQIAIYDSSNGNSIDNNAVSGGKVGIRITSNSSENSIFNNFIADSVYGIYILDGASKNKIDSNKIVNTSDTAILIQDPNTKNNVFKNNVLIDNQRNELNRLAVGRDTSLLINNTIASSSVR